MCVVCLSGWCVSGLVGYFPISALVSRFCRRSLVPVDRTSTPEDTGGTIWSGVEKQTAITAAETNGHRPRHSRTSTPEAARGMKFSTCFEFSTAVSYDIKKSLHAWRCVKGRSREKANPLRTSGGGGGESKQGMG